MPANMHHQQREDGDRDERGPEVVGLSNEGQGDHGAGQDRQEDVHAAERLCIGQRSSGEEAPVLGGEDLELGRRRFLGGHRCFSRYFCGRDEVLSIRSPGFEVELHDHHMPADIAGELTFHAPGDLTQQLGVCELFSSERREDGGLERLVIALVDRLVALAQRVFRQYLFLCHWLVSRGYLP